MKSGTFDIVVFGATSFVGKLISARLCEFLSTTELTWCLAGRSRARLDQLKESLGSKAEGLPSIIADVNDFASLTTMCEQARVVISTVGPYDLYGEPLIRACVESGTDYCDLTGEPQWIRKMLDLYENAAKQSGARIVHCAGFDSIPSDLGVHYLQRKAMERFGQPCDTVQMRIRNMRGSFSGGTLATALNMAKQIRKNPAMRRELANPYSLCPQEHGFKTRQHNVKLEFTHEFNSWVGPFVMASINTRIVHRSNALSDNAYGNNFSYNEGLMTGQGVKGKFIARLVYWTIASFFAAAGFALVRQFLARFVLARPGEGPSPEEQRNGFYDFRFIGTTEQGDKILTKVKGDMDPGYGSTAKIISQAALCLLSDVSPEMNGGFWTPATLLGDRLIERLVADAGVTFEVMN